MTESSPQAAPGADDPSRTPLRILVLGGTSWLGGEIARQAVARGHEVTCLARGSAGDPPAGVRWVRADRAAPGAYDEVRAPASGEGHEDAWWDVVLDVSWQVGFVRSALTALAQHTRHWVYVSSGSVYADDSTPDTDESAGVHEPWAGDGEVGWEQYGPAKVACERACLDALGPDRVLIARAGLIGGYGDRSDRFGYWPARVARTAAGEQPESVLVPGPLEAPVQVIDVADLAAWLLDGGERRTAGTFNAVGDVVPLERVLETCAREVARKDDGVAERAPRWVVTDPGWLEEQGVEPWAGEESVPLWLPLPAYAGFMTRSNAAAKRAGLTLRPLDRTVAATLRWEHELGLDRPRKAGLTPGRESQLLTTWNARSI